MTILAHFTLACAALASCLPSSALAASIDSRAISPWTNFNNNVVFRPPADWTDPRTLYARTLQLSDKSLLATCEIYAPDDPLSLPIFRSTDGGATWKEYIRFYDKVNGWGMRYQPFLYVLPQDFGGYKAGTILAVGTSVPKDLSQAYIDIYASTDKAKTFNFISHIAYGPGPETVPNGNKAIWEAFLLMYQGKLVAFYSDQRDPNYGQKLVHTTTTNLRDWSPIVDDVAMPYYDGRPGMTTVAYSKKSKKYVMTFENCGSEKNCQVNYKVSDSPLTFASAPYSPIVSNDTAQVSPYGSPYIIWTSKPGATDGSGIFIANGNYDASVYINDDRALPQNWKRVSINQKDGYSRALRIISNTKGQQKLLVASAGNFGEPDTNALTVGVLDVPS
ncbi:hypothetical protein SLS60_006296 [Paraconiothyrium brasiliense]|uniref:Glycoside hydrolase family 93 protein n=1 Tax=Paraconiothyrium brasiliense TaxID=300254 RepID=A0ABR3RAB9_9PLEO